MRILLVEDNADHRDLMSLALKGHESTWEVKWVGSGEEALRLLLGGEVFDLVFLDYSLPRGDGLWVLGEIRRGEASPPVVMVTGRGDEGVAVEAMQGGAYDYVVKQEGYLQRLPVVAWNAMAANRLTLERKRAEHALRESEGKYRTLVEESLQGLIIAQGLPPRIIFANSTMSEILGYSTDELVSLSPKEVKELIHPEDRTIFFQRYQERLEGRKVPSRYEVRGIRKDGTVRWTELLARRNEYQGKPAVHATFIDITEQKQAEEDLRRARTDWEDIFQAIGHPTLILDPEYKVIVANRAAAKAVGTTREELRGKKCYEIFHGADQPPEGCPLEKMSLSGHLETIEMEMEALGNWFLVSCTPVFDKKGALRNVIHIATDISERKRAEELLQKERDQAQQYLNIAGVIIVSINVDQKITLVNSKGCEILGYTANEIVGKNWFDTFLPEMDRKQVKAVFDRLMAGEIDPVEYFENAVLTREGEEKIIAWHNAVLRDEAGNIVGTLSSGEDITERKRMEDALRESEEHFSKIFYISPVPTSLTTLSGGRFLNVNDSFLNMLGYRREEVISHTAIELQWWANPADREKMLEILREHGTVKSLNVKLRSKSGEIRETLASIELIELAGEQTLLGLVQDITEQKRMQEKILRQTAVLDAVNKVLLETLTRETDEEVARSCLVVAERLTSSKFGFIGEVSPTGCFDTIALSDPGWNECRMPKSDAAVMIRGMEIRGIWGKVLKDEQSLIVNDPVSHPESVGTPEGHPPLNSFLGVPLKHAGKTFGMIALANKESGYTLEDQQDIESLSIAFVEALKRKRAEEALRKSEANYRELAESISDIFFAMDKDLKYTYWNKASENLTGISVKDAIGKSLYEIFPETKGTRAEEVYMEALRTQQPQSFLTEFRVGSNDLIFDICAYPSQRGLSVFVKDITEQRRAEKTLWESQELYRSLFEGVPIGLYRTMPDGEILDANPALIDILGYPDRESLLVVNLADIFVNLEDRKRWETLIEREGVVRDFEAQFRRHDGTVIWIRDNCHTVRHDDGQALYHEGAIQDITERKRAEEALRQSEERYRTLFEESRDVIYITTREGKFTDINRSGVELFGYTKEEMMSMNVDKIYFDPDDRPRFRQEIEQKGFVGNYEIKFRKKDGKKIDCLISAIVQRANDGSILGYQGIIRDITEQKRAEEQLLKSQQLLAKTFSSLREAVFIIDDNTVGIVDCNPASSEIFGYSREEMIGRNVAFLHVNEAEFKEFRRYLNSAIAEKGFLSNLEFKMKRKDGTVFPTGHNVMPLEDEQGRRAGWVSVVHDITERKRAEEQLRSSSEQLRALSAHLQSIREEERTLIAREIHDELGQELTGLKMDLSWLIKRLPAVQEQLVKKVELMLKLIDTTIQSVRRISTKLRPGVLDDLGLTAAIEWQAQDFQTRTMIQCEFRSNLKEVDLDRDRSTTIFRILQETLTNVARHASATRVNIYLNEAANSLVLIVEDNGRGITEKEILDPKSLGLLGMRERALVFGGEVKISGAPGKGTTVTFKIPLQK
ncbi:MAG: PAS domain S-box protein [Thermodesulfobacteriota bacterium]|jgi:PAS domain S-box-containing protein